MVQGSEMGKDETQGSVERRRHLHLGKVKAVEASAARVSGMGRRQKEEGNPTCDHLVLLRDAGEGRPGGGSRTAVRVVNTLGGKREETALDQHQCWGQQH